MELQIIKIVLIGNKIMKTKMLTILFLSLFSFSCSATNANDFKTAKQIDSDLDSNISLLDKKYVGFKKEEFIKDFGKPKKVIKDKYPYSTQSGCNSADCPSGLADELLTYEFSAKTQSGITYYSLYAYIKDGLVVRIR